MRKIGIMTMQRIVNYGSFLQAYGLFRIIKQLGYNVELVDYEFEKQLVDTKPNIVRRVLRNINIKQYLDKKKTLNAFESAFKNIYIPQLCASSKPNYRPKDLRALVIGSDEVFNCLQPYPVGYSRELFGKNYEDIPVISYAACFGQTNYKKLVEKRIDAEISRMLKRFKAISVRDGNSYETVRQLTGIEPTINLDPVLMYDFKDEIVDNVKLKDYIIVYAYPGRLTKKEERIIKKFARKHDKKIISFGMYQKISDEEIIVHPFEIFSYFKRADFVITDTFHGSIFSIKTHANFCSIVRDQKVGNSNKLSDLLKRLGQQNRILNDIDKIEELYHDAPVYKDTDNIIAKEQEKTRCFLRKNLGETE